MELAFAPVARPFPHSYSAVCGDSQHLALRCDLSAYILNVGVDAIRVHLSRQMSRRSRLPGSCQRSGAPCLRRGHDDLAHSARQVVGCTKHAKTKSLVVKLSNLALDSDLRAYHGMSSI